jgi:hypothetical protein
MLTLPSVPLSYASLIRFTPAAKARLRVLNAHAFQSGPVVGRVQLVCLTSLTYSATVFGPLNGFGPLA